MRSLRRAEAGFYVGSPPYGFDLAPDDPSPAGYQRAARRGKWRLAPIESTLGTVRIIFERAEAGTSLTKIAADLEAAGAAAPSGRWTRQAVHRIATNPIYTGRLVIRSSVFPELGQIFDGFVSNPPIEPERFDRVQERLRR